MQSEKNWNSSIEGSFKRKRAATVQFNYHISVDGMLYSVPYEYIKKKVDVKVTDTTIEIFYNHNRIASHRRLKGRPGQYSTITEHMPEDHQKYLEWNGDLFRKWAERIGINTYTVVNAILTSKRVEQQTYRSCMGLLKLAEKYSDAFRNQLDDPKFKEVPFEDRFGMLVDIEYSNRKKQSSETTDP